MVIDSVDVRQLYRGQTRAIHQVVADESLPFVVDSDANARCGSRDERWRRGDLARDRDGWTNEMEEGWRARTVSRRHRECRASSEWIPGLARCSLGTSDRDGIERMHGTAGAGKPPDPRVDGILD